MLMDPEGHELTALLARLPPVRPCRVLEIGCGDGRLTRRYSGYVSSVLAIDPDQSSIAAFTAAGVAPNVRAEARAVDALDVPDGSFDAVLFAWAL
jgi:ubiquinone/menaquinone biosynthesis C-methylase UbiE